VQMRHGGRLWPGSTLTSLSHSVHRNALAETRSGIGSDRSNGNAWNAPTNLPSGSLKLIPRREKRGKVLISLVVGARLTELTRSK
jgi:hypothetical protein